MQFVKRFPPYEVVIFARGKASTWRCTVRLGDRVVSEGANASLLNPAHGLAQDERKWRPIMDQLGVDPSSDDRWRELSKALAQQYHPDFAPKPRRGRPPAWTSQRRLNLLVDFERMREQYPRRNQEGICRALVKDTAEWSGHSAPALDRALTDARKDPWVQEQMAREIG